MAFQISKVSHFPSIDGQHQNLLVTNNIDPFLQHLTQLTNTDLKIKTLMDNFLLVACSPDQNEYKGLWKDALEESIFSTIGNLKREVEEGSIQSLDVIRRCITENPKYTKHNSCHEIIEKITYIIKNKFSSKSRYPFVGTRFSHHLYKHLGNMNNMTRGAVYLTTGLVFLMNGWNKFSPDDPTKPANKNIGLFYVGIGVGLVTAPFFSALNLARQDNP